MIVRRLAINEREVLTEGRLDLNEGLAGDSWIGIDRSNVRQHPF